MTHYRLLDSAVVSAAPGVLFDTLTDFKLAHEWWPKHYKVALKNDNGPVLGRELLLHPSRMLTIGWRIEKAVEGESMMISYSQGWHRGHGFWKFEELPGGKTKISYEIDIVPKTRWMALAYKMVDLPKRHGHDIQWIIRLLAERVGAPPPTEAVSENLLK